MKKLIFITLAFMGMAIGLFAQVVDTTAITPLPVAGSGIMDYIWWILGFIIVVVYPIFARLVPTAKNWDWLTWLVRIIGLLIPNKKKGGGTH